MKIKSPSVMLYLNGNVKNEVSADVYTHVATWESLKGITMVVVKIDAVNDKFQKKQLLQEIQNHYERYAKVDFIEYLAYDLYIEQAHHQN